MMLQLPEIRDEINYHGATSSQSIIFILRKYCSPETLQGHVRYEVVLPKTLFHSCVRMNVKISQCKDDDFLFKFK